MIKIPEYILNMLEKAKFTCSGCHEYDRSGVVGLGIRQGYQVPKDFLYVSYYCKKCQQDTSIELMPMDLASFAISILDQLEAEDQNIPQDEFGGDMLNDPIVPPEIENHREKPQPKTKITKKEVDEDLNRLQHTVYFEDLLLNMGMSPEEIKEKIENEEDGE